MQHKDTPDNNETTFFDFTDENYARVEKIMAKYPSNYRQASIIPLLDLAQRQASNTDARTAEKLLSALQSRHRYVRGRFRAGSLAAGGTPVHTLYIHTLSRRAYCKQP